MIRILIADDHHVVADGLASLLKDTFEIVGTVYDGRSLLDAAQNARADVILTDISMPGLNGLDAIRLIREKQQTARIVVLTMHSDAQLAANAFRSGASGYVLKDSPGEELISAIQMVSQGHAYLSPLIAKGVIGALIDGKKEQPASLGQPTIRQREVLQLIAEGKTMKEIANILGISPRTVESHKYEMMQLLGVSTNAELIHLAIRLKLVGG